MDAAAESYKNIGALALGLFWLAVLALGRMHKGEKARSISAQHAASNRRVATVFAVVALLSSVLLILFFIKWFTPTFQLGVLFNLIVVTMLILFAIAGLVPDSNGIRHKIHLGAALGASLLLLPAMVMIMVNDYIEQAARIFTVLATITMIYVGYKFAASRHSEKQLLIYEAVYFLCFDVSVVVVTYAH